MDLSQTAYIDSSGLGAIVSIIATVRANQGDIRLAAAAGNITNLLEITQLNKLLKCYKTVEEGVKSFSST